MKIQRTLALRCLILLPLLLATAYWSTAKEKHANPRTYVCSESDPQSVCNASTTCGSPTAACRVDVKRTDYGASATPEIAGVKGNSVFCVRVGTPITWLSTAKNTGFILDFGDSSPFGLGGAIIGGSDRPVSVVAKKEGCYKFSVGACNNKAIDGMCDEGSSEIIIAAK